MLSDPSPPALPSLRPYPHPKTPDSASAAPQSLPRSGPNRHPPKTPRPLVRRRSSRILARLLGYLSEPTYNELHPLAVDLKELAEHPDASGWTFTFGSTCSHMMPRSFFTEQSGQSPEDVFRTMAYSGSHDVVLEKVANGEFHVGALGQPPYDRASEEVRAKAPIVYTTPTFTNYALCGRADLGEEVIGQIRGALLTLHETEAGQKALEYLKAGRFIEADMSEWMGYVELIESGVDIGD